MPPARGPIAIVRGSALNWFVQNFAGGYAAHAAAQNLTLHQFLDTLASARPAGSEGLIVLPYLLGEKTPVHDPDADGCVGARRQPLGMHERAGAQLVEIEVGVAELQQAGTELVLAGVPVLLDEPVRLERLQQAVHRRDGELEAGRQLGHARLLRCCLV